MRMAGVLLLPLAASAQYVCDSATGHCKAAVGAVGVKSSATECECEFSCNKTLPKDADREDCTSTGCSNSSLQCCMEYDVFTPNKQGHCYDPTTEACGRSGGSQYGTTSRICPIDKPLACSRYSPPLGSRLEPGEGCHSAAQATCSKVGMSSWRYAACDTCAGEEVCNATAGGTGCFDPAKEACCADGGGNTCSKGTSCCCSAPGGPGTESCDCCTASEECVDSMGPSGGKQCKAKSTNKAA